MDCLVPIIDNTCVDHMAHVCWCSMGFYTILLLIATILGSQCFSYWHNNMGWYSPQQDVYMSSSTMQTPSLQLGVLCNSLTPHYKQERSVKWKDRLVKQNSPIWCRDKSCTTCESHWRICKACILYSRTRRGFTVCTEGRRQDDKLDSKSNYLRIYIHIGVPTY